jgi:hypothetical protein
LNILSVLEHEMMSYGNKSSKKVLDGLSRIVVDVFNKFVIFDLEGNNNNNSTNTFVRIFLKYRKG